MTLQLPVRLGSVREIPQYLRTSDAPRTALPAVAMLGIGTWIVILEPAAFSYSGLNLLISSAVALIFVTMAQMMIVMVGDIDLGIGAFVALINVVAATYLAENFGTGIALILLAICAYAALGALIHYRRIPSIVATLGASFVWFGIALQILPSPGGTAPAWLSSFWSLKPPFFPLPVYIALIVGIVGYLLCTRVPYAVVMRAAGDDPGGVLRAGWSVARVRIVVYAVAGIFGVLAGLAVTAVTSTGAAGSSASLTLLSVAAVVLGGSEFAGGRANPVGVVMAAIAISLVSPLLALLHISSDLQSGVQGAILLAVLAGRTLTIRGLR